MPESTKTRRDLEDTVIEKALTDDSFRRSLLADPKAAVEAALAWELPGAKLPSQLEVKALEEPPGTMYIVIPATAELSEKELEAVAGGKPDVTTTVSVGITW